MIISPLNKVMNHAADLADSKTFFKGKVAPRIIMAGGATPIEIGAIAYNAIKLPFQLALMCVKIPAVTFSLLVNSKSLNEFSDWLPGPSQILLTVKKIVLLAIGALSSLTFGLIAPMLNFRFHTSMGFVRNEKAEALRLIAEREKMVRQEAYEKEIQDYVMKIVDTIREKNAHNPPHTPNEPAKPPAPQHDAPQDAPLVNLDQPPETDTDIVALPHDNEHANESSVTMTVPEEDIDAVLV